MKPPFQKFKITFRILTPLHIGTGAELDMMEILPHNCQEGTGPYYRAIPENLLLRFDEADRGRWMAAVNKGDFPAMRNLLRKYHKPENPSDQRYTLHPMGKFSGWFKERLHSREGEFNILEIQRNLDGSILIPGSSIKGAIRTALLNYLLEQTPEYERPEKPTGKGAALNLEGKLLHALKKNEDGFDIDKDPFRMVTVRDATLPADASRVALARNRSLKREDSSNAGIPIQLETTRAAALGTSEGWTFQTEIILNTHAGEKLEEKQVPPIDINTINKACHSFFKKRFEEERDRFYKPWGIWEKTFPGANQPLCKAFERKKNEKGKVNEFYFRIGRFSHVECMTLEGYREVAPPPKGPRIQRDHGTARTLIDGILPLGWCAAKIEPA